MLVDIKGKPLKAKKMKQLIVFASINSEEPWVPLQRNEVPEWVQAPENIERLLDGEMCNDGNSPVWYIAVPSPTNEDVSH